MWIWIVISAVCFLVLIGVVIKLIYDKKRQQEKEFIENHIKNVYLDVIDQEKKIKQINEKKGRKEYFKIVNIFSDMVNAMHVFCDLNPEELKYVDILFMQYLSHYKDGFYDLDGYNELYREMAVQLDMVAPYYKFCKDDCPVVRYNDIGKEEYREKARALIDQKLLFSDTWIQLKTEFQQKFYTY